MTSIRACALLITLASTAWADPGIEAHSVGIEIDASGRRIRGHDEMRVRRGGGGLLTLRLNSSLSISSALMNGAPAEGLERVSDDGADALWQVVIPAGESERVILSVAYAGTLRQEPNGVTPAGGAILPDEASWVPHDGGASAWEVRLDLPEMLSGIMPASRVSRTPGGGRVVETWRSVGPLRRFDLTLTPLEPTSREIRGVTITSWKVKYDDGDERLVHLAGAAIQAYESLFGPYPLPRMDIVESTVERGSRVLPGLAVAAATTSSVDTQSIRTGVLAAWFGGALGDDEGRGAWAHGLRMYALLHLGVEENHPEAARQFRAKMCAAMASGSVPGFDSVRTAATFQAIRREIGDAAFLRTLRELPADRAGDVLTWDDWRAEFSKRAGRDLTAPVKQWAFRPGGPNLRLTDVRLDTSGGRLRVAGTIRQILQLGDAPWRLSVPVVVETIDGREVSWVELGGKETGFTMLVPSLALRVALDPDLLVPRQMEEGRAPIWRPLLPDIRAGSDQRRITSLMRRLGETSDARLLVVEELRIAGFDVDEQDVRASILSRDAGTALVVDDAQVAGAFPLTASPRTPEGGVEVAGVALDPGDDVHGRALLMDLPPATPDIWAFVRSTADIAEASGARLLLLRLPESRVAEAGAADDRTGGNEALWMTPQDVVSGDRDAVAMRAQMGRRPGLALPTFVVPPAFEATGTIVAHVVWEIRELNTAIVSTTISAKRGREGEVLVAARLARNDDHSATIALVEAAQILAAHSDLLGRNVRIVFLPTGPSAVPADHLVALRRSRQPAAPALGIGRVGDRGSGAAALFATADAAWLRTVVAASLARASIPGAAATGADRAALFDLGDLAVEITSTVPAGPGTEPGAKKIGRVARGIALAVIAASIAP